MVKNDRFLYMGVNDKHMSVDKTVGESDSLRGQPFVGEETTYPEEPSYIWKRECRSCFYRVGFDNPTKDCKFNPDSEKTPKSMFGFNKDEILPAELDGKEVGNYCPFFKPWDAE